MHLHLLASSSWSESFFPAPKTSKLKCQYNMLVDSLGKVRRCVLSFCYSSRCSEAPRIHSVNKGAAGQNTILIPSSVPRHISFAVWRVRQPILHGNRAQEAPGGDCHTVPITITPRNHSHPSHGAVPLAPSTKETAPAAFCLHCKQRPCGCNREGKNEVKHALGARDQTCDWKLVGKST